LPIASSPDTIGVFFKINSLLPAQNERNRSYFKLDTEKGKDWGFIINYLNIKGLHFNNWKIIRAFCELYEPIGFLFVVLSLASPCFQVRAFDKFHSSD